MEPRIFTDTRNEKKLKIGFLSLFPYVFIRENLRFQFLRCFYYESRR